MRARIGVSADADQRAFQEGLRRQLDATGLQESEYRRLIRAEALGTAITDKFKAELPANDPDGQDRGDHGSLAGSRAGRDRSHQRR